MQEYITKIKDDINNLKVKSIKDILSCSRENTALIVVDMIKGFYNEGSLASERAFNAVKPILDINKNTLGCHKVFFIDSHTKDSLEFKSYPYHCVKGTREEELIDEIKEISNDKYSTIIKKNSINGFHAADFKVWLNEHKEVETFIVTGVCTDICVETFAISLKTYFNEFNLDKSIIVPMNAVDTYNLGSHGADLMNLITFYKLKSNGIDVVKEIRF